MGKIYEAMMRFFNEDKWVVSPIEGRDSVSLSFQGNAGRWTCYARADEKREIVLFYSLCPVKAVGARMQAAIAEYFTRANYGLLVGNFEMDYSDGEVRFKTSIDIEGAELNSALMKRLVYDNVGQMDNYLPGILAIIYGGMDPAEAVRKIEGGESATPVDQAEVVGVVGVAGEAE